MGQTTHRTLQGEPRERVALVTGGARGIGLATAGALARSGARVAIGDLDGDLAASAAAGIGAGVLATSLDVADEGSFSRFVELAERELGPVDVLVNNAGIMPIGPMLEQPQEVAAQILAVNVVGCITGMRQVLPGMLARGSGHVVNVASSAGKAPVPGAACYGASKAGVIALTETARVEFAGRGVAFTCVMPSFTATDLIAGTKGTKFIGTVRPEDVAAAIVSALEHRPADVYVPRAVGILLGLQRLLGRRMRDRLNRLIGADRTFLDFDAAVRARYDTRLHPQDPPAPDAVGPPQETQ